ncbi:MAG: hypothetical protein JXR76_02260 [Deltaproteobacteria bacterium]|nr:hypothetical protein [Deltaproteobacteria bacterium]
MITHLDVEELSQSIIDEAIHLARNDHIPDWERCLEQLDIRIANLDEEVLHKPIIPPELQDAYRERIDNLSLENTTLRTRLGQTKEALERAREAYMAEREQTRRLQTKLEELEQRLLTYLSH